MLNLFQYFYDWILKQVQNDTMSDSNYIIVYLGILAIILEILLGAVTGFDLLLIGVIFIVSGGIGILTTSFTNTLISITILSLLYVFLGRAFIKNKLSIKTQKTSVDNLIGKQAIVVKEIYKNNPGQVKVEGEIWRAEANQDIDKNTSVTINSVSGTTLNVNKL